MRFWIHQAAEYLLAAALMSQALQSPRPVVIGTAGIVLLLVAATGDGPLRAFGHVSRPVHRTLDLAVVVGLGAAALVFWSDLDVVGLFVLLGVAAALAVLVAQTDYRPRPVKARSVAPSGEAARRGPGDRRCRRRRWVGGRDVWSATGCGPGAIDTVSRAMSSRRGGAQRIPRPPDWLPGGPAPWDGVSEPDFSLDAIAERLAQRGNPVALGEFAEDIRGIGPPPRPAAVLVPLFDDAGVTHVVLTKRTSHLSSHQGEISFPGGRLDPGESFADAALREAYEEVGLDPTTAEVIGELDHLRTISSGAIGCRWSRACPPFRP